MRKVIGGALVALTGASVLAVAGPVGGHAWGRASECVIVKGRGFEPKPPGSGSILCATSGTTNIAVAIAKNGQSASAAAIFGTNQIAVGVNCDATVTTNRVTHC